ncbi:MAG TPA: hypothetical protein VIG38_02660 [Hyphomicrobium sp.]|jgi:hypothetical protein
MYVSILSDEDLEALQSAIETALDEAVERGMTLSLSDITVRLFEAYVMGERDPDKLADAVVFDHSKRLIH